MMKRVVLSLSAAAALLGAGTAHASDYLFTLTGTDNFSFELDSNPTPAMVDEGNRFYVVNVPGTFTHAGSTFSTASTIWFFNTSLGGGFEVDQTGTTALFGPVGSVLYTGSESNPTFTLGTYHFTHDFYHGAVDETLVISDPNAVPPPSVPEPASWALMLAGFGVVGASMRRRPVARSKPA